jgi:hypothetical protein
MRAKISTIISTPEMDMWTELQKTSSLMYVASPLVKFKIQNHQPLPEKWVVGKQYQLKMSLCGIVPLGKHFIRIVEINPEQKTIISNEHGSLIKVWNHIIKLVPIDDQSILYTDEIEIQAGILTPVVWLFSHIFYRHRQRKWKKLLCRY